MSGYSRSPGFVRRFSTCPLSLFVAFLIPLPNLSPGAGPAAFDDDDVAPVSVMAADAVAGADGPVSRPAAWKIARTWVGVGGAWAAHAVARRVPLPRVKIGSRHREECHDLHYG